jgi:hypothetical protein
MIKTQTMFLHKLLVVLEHYLDQVEEFFDNLVKLLLIYQFVYKNRLDVQMV